MKRILVIATALACSSTPKARPTPPSEPGASQTPPSPANPPGAAVAGTPSPAPPAAGQPKAPPATPGTGSTKAEAKLDPQPDESAIDQSVDPCTDFYQYACGNWLKKTPIPEDRSSWGRGFSEINQRNELILRDILENDVRGSADPSDPFARKTADFYATCMDEHKAETASLARLQEDLRRVDAIHDPRSLAREVAYMQARGARAFFGFGSQQDFKDATQVIGGADQGGLGLPDREYYLKDDARMKDLRALYVDHVEKMLALAGSPDAGAKKQAQAVMHIETALAKASMDKVERRDPSKIYHRLERAGLQKQAPHFLWNAYFAELGTPSVQAINVLTPDFFAALDKIVGDQKKMDDVRSYLRWKEIEQAANALGKSFVEERFRFTKALTGAKQILPRWKRCVAMTDRALGEAVGRTFVTSTIGDEGKARAKEIIEGVEGAFDRNLAQVAWMDDAARTASREKLRKINNKVGYPERWRDYSKMDVGRESLLSNLDEAARFETRRDLDKIGKPVDRNDWMMTPAQVNAYYEPSLNEMVFPAGIMQSPFFKTDLAEASQYGGLGMVMGHELTHGFDDEGRQFDGDGNMHEWWSKEVAKEFTDRAECVAKQYDGYAAVEDVHLNGHLTLGENIADIGGLKMALLALRQKHGGTLSQRAEQDFFVSFAQTWCTNYRPEAARLQAQTNPHSTAQWRVNGPVADNPDFAQAFSCRQGAPMAPKDRCTVW